MLCALILAAGTSSRMGGKDKLLEEIDGSPLLQKMIEAVLAAEIPVVVSVPSDPSERSEIVSKLGVTAATVTSPTLGMGHSIAAGVRNLPKNAGAVMIIPADMPDLDSEDFVAMSETWAMRTETVIRAFDGATAGHPVIFPKRKFNSLKELTGDKGARSLLSDETVIPVALPPGHASTDLDTFEDWHKWRQFRQQN